MALSKEKRQELSEDIRHFREMVAQLNKDIAKNKQEIEDLHESHERRIARQALNC